MRCPRCGTDNPSGKSICKKCGNFLYSTYPNNRVPLTQAQKKARRKAIFKSTASGCLWTFLVVIGVFIVLGIISFVLVNYILPDDFFSGATTETTIAVSGATSESTAESDAGSLAETTIAAQ